jgi:antirestriction protein ArdC
VNRDEAKKRSEEALKELALALEKGQSETLLRYLDMLSRFHKYSFGNCMLIAMQRPDATLVAGFRRWKKLGRYVRKGEQGIAILAPLVYRAEASERSSDDVQEEKLERLTSVCGFRVVYVFDVSQTEGDALPEFAAITGDPGEKLLRLEEIVRAKGIELSYAPISGGAQGLSEGGKITVVPTLSTAETFSVLAHELGHELLHRTARRNETTKTVRETEAEAVAYVVCRACGLECSTRCSDYIQLYQGNSETLQESLDHIQRVSSVILTELETPPQSSASLKRTA